MATKKITQKLRRFTHPNCENYRIKIPARLRQRSSIDVGHGGATSGTRDKENGRDAFAEGRLQTSSAKHPKALSSPAGQKVPKAIADDTSDKTEKPGRSADGSSSSSSGPCFASPAITVEKSPDWTEASVGRQDRSPDRSRLHASKSKTITLRLSRSSDRSYEQDAYDRTLPMTNFLSLSNPLSDQQLPSCDAALASPASPDGQRGRSQIKRAWSLFFLTSEKEEAANRHKLEQRRILRSPTRHVYRRGLSGLPILHTANEMGLAF